MEYAGNLVTFLNRTVIMFMILIKSDQFVVITGYGFRVVSPAEEFGVHQARHGCLVTQNRMKNTSM
jgi:hypothetical protein